MEHETKYAKSGDTHIAYQVAGDGPRDLVFVMGWISHIDYLWEGPAASFLTRLASFSRLIVFDKRGTGLSDRVAKLPTMEERMDDVRAVMDAAGSSRAALLGISEGAAMCALFAATYPDRTDALLLYGSYARRLWHPDYPWAPTPEERTTFFDAIEHGWGGVVDLDSLAPTAARDPSFRKWWATYLQRSASPGAALALAQMNTQIDIRHVLPAIRVPTLILHRTGDLDIDIGGARYLADHIRGAKFIELPGDDHLVFAGDQESVLGEVEKFLTGSRSELESETVLATVLVAEIVEAMATATRLGVERWQGLLDRFSQILQSELGRYRGIQVQVTSSGFVATFDGPVRAIRAAGAIAAGARVLGLGVRLGLHTGEWEINGGDMHQMSVEIAGRVMANAAPGEVVVSSTVADLVAGSGLKFEPLDRRPISTGGRRLEMLHAYPDPPHSADGKPPPSSPSSGNTRLSPRELEIALLISHGHSNRDIADELSISRSTVERHVSNIFNKLGVHTRTQVAVWATELNLSDVDSNQ